MFNVTRAHLSLATLVALLEPGMNQRIVIGRNAFR